MTPLTVLRLAELGLEAGLPPGVFTVLAGKGSIVGHRFVTNPLVRKVVFTGSTEVGKGVMAGLQWTLGGMWAVVAAQVLVAWPNWRGLLTDGTLDTYVRIFASVMERHIPWAYFEPTLPGAFAMFMTAAAICFIAMMIGFVGLLAALPLFGFVIMASSSAEALKNAEGSKTQSINKTGDISTVVHRVAAAARETFAPQLVVVRVAGLI